MQPSIGIVVFVSRNQGMIVVHHDDGYAVVELLGDEGELSIGDQLTGDWDALGGEEISSPRLRRTLSVYMQGTWGRKEHAIGIATNTGGGLPLRR